MDEKEAIRLLDAHLDQHELTPEQFEDLKAWIKENLDHADQAYRRILLHTYLRNRVQISSLVGSSLRISDSDAIVIHDWMGESSSSRKQAWFFRRSTIWVLVAIVLLVTPSAILLIPRTISSQNSRLFVYEDFDYPSTTPLPDVSDMALWPTTGGLEGLSGGIGWSDSWRELGPKVSIVVDDVQASSLGPEDMRKFKLLGYSDADGRSLRRHGIQFRTSYGPISHTNRLIDESAFPDSMKDDLGVGRDGAVLWLSFVTQSYSSKGGISYSYLQLGSEEAGIHVGKLAAVPSGNWSICAHLHGGELNAAWTDTPSGTPVFIVVRIEFRTGDEMVHLWLNPQLDTIPEIEGADAHIANVPDFRIKKLSFFSRFSTDFDEIRIGESFRAVAPVQY